jgi:hypothetical protein
VNSQTAGTRKTKQPERLQCAAPPVAPDTDPKAANQSSQEQLARRGLSQEQHFVGRESELRQLVGDHTAACAKGCANE